MSNSRDTAPRIAQRGYSNGRFPDPDGHLLRIDRHFRKHFGAPNAIVRPRRSTKNPVSTWFVAPRGRYIIGVPYTFLSQGASSFRQTDGRRNEAVMLFQKLPRDNVLASVHRIMTLFAWYGSAKAGPLYEGELVFAEADLKPLCPMQAILFASPVVLLPPSRSIELGHGQKADLTWLVPIFEREAAYAIRYGLRDLMLLLYSEKSDPTNLNRRPADTSVSPAAAMEIVKARSKKNISKS